MIINNFDIFSARISPSESHSKLIIDPNAVLPAPVPCERFKAIPWNRTQIGEFSGGVQVVQFALRHGSDPLEFPAELAPKDLLGFPVQEAPNHASRILLSHV